jgi:LysR family transcriptional regulator, regulator of abg operon
MANVDVDYHGLSAGQGSRTMRLQQLHLLITLAETGSLRAAAETLNVTQPALTKSLKQLEQEFGATLVLRSAKGVRLAPAGELLAARAATALRELERAREEVAWHTQNTRGTVTVGVSPAAGLLLAPPALSRFRARWPNVMVRLIDALYPNALQQLRSAELDMALGPLPAVGIGRDLQAQPLVQSASVIVARRGHPLVRARSLQDLKEAAWMITGPRLGPGDPIHLRFEEKGLTPPQVTLACESFSTLLALLPTVDMLALVPKRFFESHGARIGLAAVNIDDSLPPTTIHLFTRSDAPLTLHAQRLLEAFVHEASLV